MHLGIWQHFARGKDNKEYVRYSLKLQKRFYDEDKEKQALELGAYSFLHKSVKFEDFLGMLNKIEKSLNSRKGKTV